MPSSGTYATARAALLPVDDSRNSRHDGAPQRHNGAFMMFAFVFEVGRKFVYVFLVCVLCDSVQQYITNERRTRVGQQEANTQAQAQKHEDRVR